MKQSMTQQLPKTQKIGKIPDLISMDSFQLKKVRVKGGGDHMFSKLFFKIKDLERKLDLFSSIFARK